MTAIRPLAGYPNTIAGSFPGLPAAFQQDIGAAFSMDDNVVYLFKCILRLCKIFILSFFVCIVLFLSILKAT